MTDQETSSESNEEMVDATADAPEANARYNLRSGTTTKKTELSHRGSPLYQAVNRGELGARSEELVDNLRKSLVSVAQVPPSCVAPYTVRPVRLSS